MLAEILLALLRLRLVVEVCTPTTGAAVKARVHRLLLLLLLLRTCRRLGVLAATRVAAIVVVVGEEPATGVDARHCRRLLLLLLHAATGLSLVAVCTIM